jgi:hypothetical protein
MASTRTISPCLVQSFCRICTLSRFPKRTKASVSTLTTSIQIHTASTDTSMASSTHSRSLYTRILRSSTIITHGLYNNLNTSSGNGTASTFKQSGKQFRCRSMTTIIAIFFFSNSARGLPEGHKEMSSMWADS